MIIRRCSTKGAFEVIPDNSKSLNFDKIKKNFKLTFEIPMLIMFNYKTYSITCYKNGKTLIKNCKSEEEANELAGLIYG